MCLRILGCVAVIALVLQSCSAWYVIRELGPTEGCVNSTLKMAGNQKCPVPSFPIVNSTKNLEGIDKLQVLTSFASTPCLEKVIRMSCVKETEVCSTDHRYAVSKITQQQCMAHMTCLPEGSFPQNMRMGLCQTLPDDSATAVPGPVFIIGAEQKKTESNSECLRQSAFTIAAILTFVIAYMQL